MIFGPKRKSIARRDSIGNRELQHLSDFSGMPYPNGSTHKEMSLFSKKNFSYVDNRKITIISNSTIIIKL